jgi:pimeloyl-ACP methyl ester carboxylesterase
MKRLFFILLTVLVLLLLGGAIYQVVGTVDDARRYPPPGQLYKVGDYGLHLYCTGQGRPTVVLETMAGGTSVNWGWVQPEVAGQTRVCAYDRAGRGWSEPGIPASDLWGTAEDLHALLAAAGESPPYVLVGHSIGGLHVRGFTARYPDEVAGIILLDSSHPEQFDRYPEFAEENEGFQRIAGFFPALARLGIMRIAFAAGAEIDFADLAAQQHDELVAFWSSPQHWQSQLSEGKIASVIYDQAKELGDLGDRPLIVVSAGVSRENWKVLQTELPGLSSNSRQIIIDGATHESLVFNPDHAHQTSQAILEVAASVSQP